MLGMQREAQRNALNGAGAPAIWFDAQRLAGASGDAIAAHTDRVGRAWAQATAGQRCTVQRGVATVGTAMRGAGAQNLYTSATVDLTATKALTLAWCSQNVGGTDQILVEIGPNGGTTNGGLMFFREIAKSVNMRICGNVGMDGKNTAVFADASWHVWVLRVDMNLAADEIIALYKDGVSQALTALFAANNTSTFQNLTIYLMSRVGGVAGWVGDLTEMVLWPRDLGAAVVPALSAELKAAWGF
ncbi:MAG: hypothetical protein WC700_18065 [Gemmatimonadaceae bacterium]|jgi:hypothetical protein